MSTFDDRHDAIDTRAARLALSLLFTCFLLAAIVLSIVTWFHASFGAVSIGLVAILIVVLAGIAQLGVSTFHKNPAA